MTARILGAACVVAAGGALVWSSPASPASTLTAVPATWTQSPDQTTGPDARESQSMSYDAALGSVVMFGGATADGDSPTANDTWSWSGTSWKQVDAATNPSPRAGASMAFDAASNQLLMFGGGNQAFDGSLATQSDTWDFTGSTWVQLHPVTTPLSRLAGSMAYDPGNSTVVLFGGADAGGDSLADTWVWNGHSWRQMSPAHSPGRRVDAAMASDPASGDVVLFGGVGGSGQTLSDTWIWDGSDWTQLDTFPQPGARSAAVMDYDAVLGKIVLTSGAADDDSASSAASPVGSPADGVDADTWTFSGSSWTPLVTAGSAPDVSGAAGAFDLATSQFVVFGGVPGTDGSPAASSPAADASSDDPTFSTSATSLLTGGAVAVNRLAGADRIGTSIAVSTAEYPAGKADSVVLVRDDVLADGLTGGPLAAFERGPLLLTDPHSLTAETRLEISRVLPAGGSIFLLGGTSAIAPGIETELTAAGYKVERIAGADRFSTAVAIATAMGTPSTVFEVAATDIPDALSGVPAAIHDAAPILLTNGSRPDPATTDYLDTQNPGKRYALGAPAVAADPTATPISGADRYATSALVASTIFRSPLVVGVAAGNADALAAGAYVGMAGGPLLLLPPSGVLPPESATYLTSAKSTATGVTAFGGLAALDQAMLDQVGVALS